MPSEIFSLQLSSELSLIITTMRVVGNYVLYQMVFFTYFRYRVRLPDERFTVTVPKTSGWFHIVLNYIPGNETTDVGEPGHEIRVYHDGILVGSDF